MLDFERPRPRMGTEDEVVLRRIAAFVVDAILFAIALAILAAIVGTISDLLASLVGALGTVLFFVYFIYFEAEYGQTVGKMALGLVVVTEDGTPIDYRAAVIRTLLRIIDALPVLYLIGLLAIVLTDRKQRLGDIVADTVVVRSVERGEKL